MSDCCAQCQDVIETETTAAAETATVTETRTRKPRGKKGQAETELVELLTEKPGLTRYEVAAELGYSDVSAGAILAKLQREGKIAGDHKRPTHYQVVVVEAAE